MKQKGQKVNKKGESSATFKKQKKKNSKSDMSKMSVSDFMNSTLDSTDSDDESNANNTVMEVNGDLNKSGMSTDEKIDSDEVTNDDDSSEDGDNNDEDSDDNLQDDKAHKKSLNKLRETDPEFYKYLEENDKKLLQFNVLDSEDDDDDDDDKDEEEKVHKPSGELEVASDESDFEVEGEEVDKRVVTLKMVEKLQYNLHNRKSLYDLKDAVLMFNSALKRIESNNEEKPRKYIVDGSSVFNAVVQMCVMEMGSAIKRSFKIPSKGIAKPARLTGWNKRVKILLRMYFKDLIKFLDNVSSTDIIAVLLKHMHQLIGYFQYYPRIIQPTLKRLVKLWGSGEETVRVIAFLCILKITTNDQSELLERVLKMMYLTYVSNCKFVSPTTLPLIQFMRRSLAEMFALDEAASYKLVFLYVRQLAIHLRNAIIIHSKEILQSVYNWQFIQSLHLWTEVLGTTAHGPHLRPLLYPLVQVIIGTIKLIPTAQYYPLRFTCVQMLIQLSKQTGTFIPVLPFVIEVLGGSSFKKPHKVVSMKALDFSCVLRLSKAELEENGFKEAVVAKVYQLLIEYLASEAHTISFPDLVVPVIFQLKSYIKEITVAKYTKKLKQALDKIQENSKVIEAERSKVSFSLTDRKAIDAWETNMKLKGTPLASFYESWIKIERRLIAKRTTKNDEIGDFNLPTIKKFINKKRSNSPVELFPSDESETEVAPALAEPTKSAKKRKHSSTGGKNKKVSKIAATDDDDDDDIPEGEDTVQDLRLSDLE